MFDLGLLLGAGVTGKCPDHDVKGPHEHLRECFCNGLPPIVTYAGEAFDDGLLTDELRVRTKLQHYRAATGYRLAIEHLSFEPKSAAIHRQELASPGNAQPVGFEASQQMGGDGVSGTSAGDPCPDCVEDSHALSAGLAKRWE